MTILKDIFDFVFKENKQVQAINSVLLSERGKTDFWCLFPNNLLHTCETGSKIIFNWRSLVNISILTMLGWGNTSLRFLSNVILLQLFPRGKNKSAYPSIKSNSIKDIQVQSTKIWKHSESTNSHSFTRFNHFIAFSVMLKQKALCGFPSLLSFGFTTPIAAVHCGFPWEQGQLRPSP